ncbi:L-dopachrome tautomerase-related protein [Rhizosphaericola mali]|uniref:Gluconolactonase n=1 Tax=Rhizosphaericola mali TaxID=2545455 RepID=A0A5P2G0S5_9BACT|nr:L-dopachrome tautomerase-related protein [Rhizosphaericola mali]QES87719.1 gluconolactonase [Rhizosphaericola mali]
MKKKVFGLFILATTLLGLRLQAQKLSPLPDKVSVVAAINSPNPDPSGIALSSSGRLFLGFPRHADNHTSFALAEYLDGKLIPFPSKEYVYPSLKPYTDWLVSPHGIFMDKNDVLWVLDDGKRAGIKEIPEGAGKVVGIDIKTKKIIASVPISKNVMSNETHLNDFRVDLTHGAKGTAYIANSGFGERYSLIVVDIASGKCREVLLNKPCVSPEPGFMAFLEMEPHVMDVKKQTFPIGGPDGITLSSDSKKLYWTAISSRKLYSISTDTLSNQSLEESAIEKAVTFEGEHPACDGMASDEQGNLYFGSFEQLSTIKRTPDGQYTLLAHDIRFAWQDGLAYHDGYLYMTLGQWNRLPGFNNGKDLRQPPYLVVKVKTK